MKRLLIALRSQTFTDALVRALDPRFDVHICRTGTQVCRLAAKLQPDALVIDLRLPDGDGISVLERCKYKPAAVLMLTDLYSREILRRAAEAGVDRLTIVPCSAGCIAEALEQMVIKNSSPE